MIKKDGYGYGDLDSQHHVMDNSTVSDDETYVGAPSDKPIDEHETYIGKESKSKTDMNKITSTKIGDEIRYISNGVEGTGVVAKMSNSYITIFKSDGQFYDVHINDTFYVKDILLNKTWDDMTPPERVDILQKVHAPSPRYLVKSWLELPPELREAIEKTVRGKQFAWNKMDEGVRAEYNIGSTADWGSLTSEQRKKLQAQGVHHGGATSTEGKPVLQDNVPKNTHFGTIKSDVEAGGYGSVAGNPYAPIATGTPVEAPKDYEGQSDERTGQNNVEFQHEKKKPEMDEDKKKSEEQKMRGEFVYTEATKYRTKGVPETQAPTWGIKYVRKDSEEKED